MTDENKKDTHRALAAAKAIFDGRGSDEMPAILVTTEHAIATVLLAVCGKDARAAAAMLSEGLIPGIEERLSMYGAARLGGHKS